MIIRKEKTSDYDEVYQLVKTSFATVYEDGKEPDEQDYLNELREKEEFIPELSFVAENDEGKLIGQIVLYKTTIDLGQGKLVELLLSPICVHPGYFRRGIARMMVETALAKAKKMGFKAVFLCGEPEIYKRLGFEPSYLYNIIHKNDKTKNAQWSMVRELSKGALKDVSGTIDTI